MKLLVLFTARKICTFERDRKEHCSKYILAKSDHVDTDCKAEVAIFNSSNAITLIHESSRSRLSVGEQVDTDLLEGKRSRNGINHMV